jgi:hypothetical protein
MPGVISDSPLARDLIRVGNDAIAREDPLPSAPISGRTTSSTDQALNLVSTN